MTELVKVSCRDCRYEKEVDPDADELPADYIIEHGEETGHTVKVEAPDSD